MIKNNHFKIIFSYILKAILFPFRVFPIKDDRIIFCGLTGGDDYEYCGNGKYLCEYIEEHEGGRFRPIWIVGKPNRYQTDYPNILFLKHYSVQAFYYLMTTKVVVTSGSYAPWFPFRKSQLLINTWHGGGAYKKIASDLPKASIETKKQTQKAAQNTSLFVSSCQKASELEFRGAFSYQGEILEVGMPRNDVMVDDVKVQDGQNSQSSRAAMCIAKVHEKYNITADEKIILYAPTYRDSEKEIILDETKLLKLLESGGQSWRLLFRAHRNQEANRQIRVSGYDYIDVTNYPDMQELLLAADMVITDYSSLIWDYAILKRPCFLYTPDSQEYLDKTGFYVDIKHWPFEQADDMDELINLIRKYNPYENSKKIIEHQNFMGSFENGQACEKITKWILEKLERE